MIADFGASIPKYRSTPGTAPINLRILDARNARATHREIAEVIGKKARETAEKLTALGRKASERIFDDQDSRDTQGEARKMAEKLTGVPWPRKKEATEHSRRKCGS